MKLIARTIVILLLTSTAVAADQLPRRSSAGLAVGADQPGGGAVVREVFPNSGAAAAGLQAGDVILDVNGKPVSGPGEFVAALKGRKVGEKVVVSTTRGGEARKVELTLKEFAKEQSSEFDVVYDSAAAEGFRYRMVYTKPKGTGPFRLLFIVQGVGCGSIDNPPPGNNYTRLVREVTLAGIATLRVDKPGVGDSEGGPCTDAPFAREVSAFRAALAAAKKQTFVQKNNIVLFGHSMGGVQAPLIAPGDAVRGIAVFGTAFQSWMLYSFDNLRRQMRLGGADFAEIGDEEKSMAKFASLFFVQKMPLQEIVRLHPEYAGAYPDGKTYAAGKAGSYFQEINDVNLAREWKNVDADVLSVWGASDFLSSESDHEWLAAAVNSFKPGRAKFVKLEGVDHWLNKAPSQLASMDRERSGGEAEYDARLTQLLIDFTRKPAPR